MEENRNGYDPQQDEDVEYVYEDEQPATSRKAIRGYRIVISILAVVLVAISLLYFNIHRQQSADMELLRVDRDSIQSDLSALIVEYDNMKFTNDTIRAELEKAHEVMEQLKRERRWNYAKIKEYEKEVGTLRTVMRGYIRQIDSLNTLNKQLITENVSYKKEISTANLRAEMAEESASELRNKVAQGAVLRARSIALVPLNAKSKEVTRVKTASRLRADFEIVANALASPGQRTVYLRILSPDGYVLTTADTPVFDFEGERLPYSASRDIDYEQADLPVSIFYTSEGFTAGNYTVELYADGRLIGSSEVLLR